MRCQAVEGRPCTGTGTGMGMGMGMGKGMGKGMGIGKGMGMRGHGMRPVGVRCMAAMHGLCPMVCA